MSGISKNSIIVGGTAGLVGLLVGSLISSSSVKGRVEAGVEAALAPARAQITEQQTQIAQLTDQLGAVTTETRTAVAALSDLQAGQDEMSARTDELSTSLAALSGSVENRFAEVQASQAEALAAALTAKTETRSAPKQSASLAALEDDAEQMGVGKTAIFADGAVRAFVQRLDPSAGRAVVSLNGTSAQLDIGQSTVVRHDAGTCRVGLASLSKAGAGIASDCDISLDSGKLGDVARPGSLVQFEDGKLNVFLSGIIKGDARLAINGLDTQILAVGDSITTDEGCTVTLNGVRGSAVGVSGTCN